MWTLHPDFLKEVESNWAMPSRNVGLKKLKEKLFRLKQFFIWWNKHTFGNIFDKVKKFEAEVLTAELAASSNPSVMNAEILKNKQIQFSLALDQEE